VRIQNKEITYYTQFSQDDELLQAYRSHSLIAAFLKNIITKHHFVKQFIPARVLND